METSQSGPTIKPSLKGFAMASADYRIESTHPFSNRLLPASKFPQVYQDRSLAVVMAAKSVSNLAGQEVRVVHVPTGEIVFRKTSREA